MLSPTCFEPLCFICRETVVYAGWYVLHASVSPDCTHTDTRKTYHTAYTAISLRMKARDLKHVGDNRN